MEIPPIISVQSANQARALAIDWQAWASEQDLSYQELADWQAFFEVLAMKFNLADEFKENCII